MLPRWGLELALGPSGLERGQGGGGGRGAGMVTACSSQTTSSSLWILAACLLCLPTTPGMLCPNRFPLNCGPSWVLGFTWPSGSSLTTPSAAPWEAELEAGSSSVNYGGLAPVNTLTNLICLLTFSIAICHCLMMTRKFQGTWSLQSTPSP